MRVVSLVPAGTETVAALGGAGLLVGISHECDYPPYIRHLPRVTGTAIDPNAPGAVIDAATRALRAAGRPVITVDPGTLEGLRPDLLITQSQCGVCAAEVGAIRRLAEAMTPPPVTLSLGAETLGGIWQDIHAIGEAIGLREEAEELIVGLNHRLSRLAPAVRARYSQAVGIPRVLCIEWLDPVYFAGHWVPELVGAAGGEDVGAEPGGPSLLRDWATASRLRPDLIIIMLCGFDVARAEIELAALTDPTALALLGSTPTWILDGNAYTSRPGPRVVDGAERIRAAMAGEAGEGLRRWNG